MYISITIKGDISGMLFEQEFSTNLHIPPQVNQLWFQQGSYITHHNQDPVTSVQEISSTGNGIQPRTTVDLAQLDQAVRFYLGKCVAASTRATYTDLWLHWANRNWSTAPLNLPRGYPLHPNTTTPRQPFPGPVHAMVGISAGRHQACGGQGREATNVKTPYYNSRDQWPSESRWLHGHPVGCSMHRLL